MNTRLGSVRDSMRAGLEAVDFQVDKKFGKAIEEEIKELRKLDRIPKDSDLRQLERIVKHHTNISISMKTFPYLNAAAEIPRLTANSPLFKDYLTGMHMQDEGEKLISKKDVIKGGVDISRGMVSGDFTDITLNVYLGTPLLNPKRNFTPDMTTAMFLHEIGHIFTYFELLYRTTTGNYIVNNISERLMKTNDKNTKIEILKDARAKGYAIDDMDSLVAANSKELVSTIVLQDHIAETRSELDANLYDIRGAEALADNYAIRMGYGKGLAKGLRQLGGSGGFIMSVFIHMAFVINPVAFILLTLLESIMPGDVYDKPKDRMRVIRQELSRSLKESDMNKDQIKETLRDLDEVEEVLENTKNYRFLSSIVADILPWRSKKVKATEIQKKLESLANNRLHEAAARVTV